MSKNESIDYESVFNANLFAQILIDLIGHSIRSNKLLAYLTLTQNMQLENETKQKVKINMYTSQMD